LPRHASLRYQEPRSGTPADDIDLDLQEATVDVDQRARLWEHRLHEDSIFNSRQNYFLIAQSMFAIAYATAVVGDHPEVGVSRALALLALVGSFLILS
jgi:hypothetical protein